MDLLLVTLQRLFVAGEHGSSITGASVREALKGAEEMPWPIRFAAKRFLVRGDLQAIALEILADPDLSAGSLASVKERYAARIRDCVLTQIVDVNKRWLWTLAAANGCAGVMAWLLLR